MKFVNSVLSAKILAIGIPQGFIIVLMLFNIMIHDLPESLSHATDVVQHVDGIAT